MSLKSRMGTFCNGDRDKVWVIVLVGDYGWWVLSAFRHFKLDTRVWGLVIGVVDDSKCIGAHGTWVTWRGCVI